MNREYREPEITFEEAKAFIEEWLYKDDFVCRNSRITSVEGDDNSIELAYYWQQHADVVSLTNPQLIEKQ